MSLLYPYLAGIVLTLALALICLFVFIVVRRKALELDILEQRIPDAARYNDLKARLIEAESEWTEMKHELSEARSVMARKDEAQQWLNENKQQLQSIEAERDLQERIRVELTQLQQQQAVEVEQARERALKLQSLQFETQQLQDELKSLKPAVDRLQSEEKNLKASISSFEGERAKLEQLIQSSRTQATDLKQEVEKLRAIRDNLIQEEKQLRMSISALNGEQAGLEKTIKRLQHDAGKQDDRLADLWQPVLSSKSFTKNNSDDETKCLASTQDYIEQLGLKFSDRTIKAFHTSLKVADISPLVVLAGISGTGKSALPRRYAEGMGMHCLNIAVQPRWDNPQDMFGFYNYMEGRYRATELARALVQMDPFFAQEGRGWPKKARSIENNLSHQMLLVLLDEMNLARVEYYFSEFLSRLEIRGGLTSDKPQYRRKAEIPLEIGGTSGDDSILYLYTDRNVLFVGTMNEDETTQTLSDKVIDRANVLRFGKPTTLNRPVTEDVTPERCCTPYGNWLSWLKTENDLDDASSDQVNTWIAKLNELMNNIGKPFAYRTHKAMRTYVANYPHEGSWDDALRHAMADQIEQKILPKFRGMDYSERQVEVSMSSLCQLLEELKDHQLIDAINKARSADSHLFAWQGLDRTISED